MALFSYTRTSPSLDEAQRVERRGENDSAVITPNEQHLKGAESAILLTEAASIMGDRYENHHRWRIRHHWQGS
jgi:hypothetical protein